MLQCNSRPSTVFKFKNWKANLGDILVIQPEYISRTLLLELIISCNLDSCSCFQLNLFPTVILNILK